MSNKTAIPIRVGHGTNKSGDGNGTKSEKPSARPNQAHKQPEPSARPAPAHKQPEGSSVDCFKASLRSRNKSGPTTSGGSHNQASKAPAEKPRTVHKPPAKSFSEQRKEKQMLVEEVTTLKGDLECVKSDKSEIEDKYMTQLQHIAALEERNLEIEKKMSITCDKLFSCETYLETLGIDPVSRDRLDEECDEKSSQIEDAMFTAEKLKEELVAYKERNNEIISTLEEILLKM